MANPEHVEILKQGAEVWNQWRENRPPLPIVDLESADLEGFDLRGFDLSYANLSNANLKKANFKTSNLTYADLKGADIRGSNLMMSTLNGAHLNGAYLNEAQLNASHLEKADLTWATLSGANLYLSNLKGANFTDADLDNVNFGEANLSGANFTRAGLGNAAFNRTTLIETSFAGASFYHTVLSDMDLGGAKELDTIKHHGPSYISFETLFHSQNKNVPEIFWRGCGVDKEMLQHMKDQIWQPIQYESCFISYSHKDEEFARRLYERMYAANLRVWYAPEDMAGGKKIHEQIDQAIQRHDRLLLVLSEHSMSSEWVKTEIYNARQREIKENRRILFPLALVPFSQIREWQFFDGDTGKDLAREVREYFIPDFTNWKNHDVFEATFARLLRDLKLKNVQGSK